MKGLSMAALLAATGLVTAGTARAADFPADKVKAVSADVDSGLIRVTGRDGDKISVSIDMLKDPSACRVTTEIQDTTLVLRIKTVRKGMGMFGTSKCSANLIVQAPKGLPLDAVAGSASIEAESLSGKASLAAGSGGIRLKDVGGDLRLRTGSGSIEGEAASGVVDALTGSGSIHLAGLRGTAQARTGSGAVSLHWERSPKDGDVKVRTGSGSVSLEFPEGTKLSASLISGSGRVANELGESPDAKLRVSVITGSGDATVRKAK